LRTSAVFSGFSLSIGILNTFGFYKLSIVLLFFSIFLTIFYFMWELRFYKDGNLISCFECYFILFAIFFELGFLKMLIYNECTCFKGPLGKSFIFIYFSSKCVYAKLCLTLIFFSPRKSRYYPFEEIRNVKATKYFFIRHMKK
jgi:hypothetical protein